ncbi:hypothetical protein HDU97_003222 [Phlyctochytrium planicorne]|nr:hypothetical protein HDU97_003222 [Phlyctochytrium planicorne]
MKSTQSSLITGVFEFHITVRSPSGNDAENAEFLRLLQTFCELHKLKLTVIHLNSGDFPKQVMIGRYTAGRSDTIQATLHESYIHPLIESGFEPIRLKIESIASNEGVPMNQVSKASSEFRNGYFEFHWKLELYPQDLPNLHELASEIGGLHVSRNAHKLCPDGRVHIFLTARDHGGGKVEALDMHQRISDCLKLFKVLKKEREFVVVDTNLGLDNGWEPKWNEYATQYAKWDSRNTLPFVMDALEAIRLPQLISKLKEDKRLQILDVAAGTGRFGIEAIKIGGSESVQVISTDFAPNFVELTQRTAVQELGKDVAKDALVVAVMDGENDGMECIREMYRVLRPKGVCVLTTWQDTFLQNLALDALRKEDAHAAEQFLTSTPPTKRVSWHDGSWIADKLLTEFQFATAKATRSTHVMQVQPKEREDFASYLANGPGVQTFLARLGWPGAEDPSSGVAQRFERAVLAVLHDTYGDDGVCEFSSTANIIIGSKNPHLTFPTQDVALTSHETLIKSKVVQMALMLQANEMVGPKSNYLSGHLSLRLQKRSVNHTRSRATIPRPAKMTATFSKLTNTLFSMHPLQLDPAAFGVDMSASSLLSPTTSQLNLKFHFNIGSNTSLTSCQTKISSVPLGITNAEPEFALEGSVESMHKAALSRLTTSRTRIQFEDDEDDYYSEDEEGSIVSDRSAVSEVSRADSGAADLNPESVATRLLKIQSQDEKSASATAAMMDTIASIDDDPRGPPPAYHSPPNSLQSSAAPSSEALSQCSSSSSKKSSSVSSYIPNMSSVAGEVGFAVGLGFHQLHTISTGIFSLMSKGSSNPSWPAALHMTLHWLRNQLHFKGHTMDRARAACDAAKINLAPPGCKLTSVDMYVCRRELLKFEAEALRFHKQFSYPIPAEIDEHGEPVFYSDYKLDGEWIEVGEPAPDCPKSKWFGWFWGRGARKEMKDFGSSNAKPRKTILYLHGGAYVIGNPAVYRHLTGRIAAETGCRMFVANYRLAPEFPFPAALHDALAAFLYLINPYHPAFKSSETGDRFPVHHEPIAPEDIVLMGDSAGGGLCMSLLNYLKDYLRWPNGSPMLPMPGGAILISPWVDLTFASQSWRDNAEYDWLPPQARNIHDHIIAPSGDNKGIAHPVHMYVFGNNTERQIPLPSINGRRTSISSPTNPFATSWTGKSWRETLLLSASDREKFRIRDVTERLVRHPLISPVFAEDLSGLPPILIQAGDCEVLRDETLALAYRYHISNLSRRRSSIISLNNAASTSSSAGRPKSFIRHEMYADMVHVFPAIPWLPAAQLSLRNMKRFIGELEDMSENGFVDWEDGRSPTRGYPEHHQALTEEEAKILSLNEHLSLQ